EQGAQARLGAEGPGVGPQQQLRAGGDAVTVCFGDYNPNSMECQRCECKEACAVDAWFEGEIQETEEGSG
ncbi:MAG: hypothetical protein ABC527_06885, partial [Candidatus Methanosuratincola petrocarbonis]